MTDPFVTYELDGEIALIGLNRPDKRNAMHGPLFEQLATAVHRAGSEARAGVVFGHGGQFSAGLDLGYAVRELGGMDPVKRRREPDPSRTAFNELARGPIPFVAALHGAVVGAGFELAASAHVRVCDPEAFFSLPEGMRGIFVGGGGSVRIQRLIGYGRMADMMLTGRTYVAADAERMGAVQYVSAPGQTLEKAKEIARRIAGNTPLSNWAVTNALPRLGDMSDDEGLFFETMAATFIVTDESNARMIDFVEGRASRVKAPPFSQDVAS